MNLVIELLRRRKEEIKEWGFLVACVGILFGLLNRLAAYKYYYWDIFAIFIGSYVLCDFVMNAVLDFNDNHKPYIPILKKKEIRLFLSYPIFVATILGASYLATRLIPYVAQFDTNNLVSKPNISFVWSVLLCVLAFFDLVLFYR